MPRPEVLSQDGNIKVFVCFYEGETKCINTKFVLDLNQFGQVIGMEVLNIKLSAGYGCLKQIKKNIGTTGDGLKYSYDEDSDSFYLQIVNERSMDQITVEGILSLEMEGSIVCLEASYS